jgi:hypothetical protein
VTDTVHREFNLTARQAVQKFGNGNLPAKIRAAETKTLRRLRGVLPTLNVSLEG